MFKEKEDYYFMEGGYIVFTEQYHLKRGYCCKNGCRHCPWKKSDSQSQSTNKMLKKEL